ncbi:hypothetical protein Tco_1348873, partial [Tanacetum coccineum]
MHQSMEGIQRSGRVKGKGPVIEENTIDEAIDVDEYLSEEDSSEYSIKSQDYNRDDGASTSGTKKLKDKKDGKITKKRKMDNTIGNEVFMLFGTTLIKNTMEIKLENASLLITMETIADMIGIINKGVDILVEDVVKDMMYVDGTVCKAFRVGRKRPPTTMWTKELLKERELVEIKSRGIGKGELEGPYVEEQDDPMTDNLKERCGFERTFDAAKEMFPGNTIFADLERRFIEALQYQKKENEDIGGASVHTEDETMASEGQEQSMEAGDRTGGGLDSPSLGFTQGEHDIGPETQKEIANTSEKGLEAFSGGNSESSFSSDMEENRVKARQEPLDVVPLNFFSPKNEVMVLERRAVTLTECMKSPFYIRVVNADKVKKCEVLFKTKYGHQCSRGQIETLGPQEPVDDNVVTQDKKLFAGDNAYTLEMFMEYAENANSSYEGQAMLEKADI